MTVKELANYLAKQNKKKSESKVGDNREDVKNLSVVLYKEWKARKEKDQIPDGWLPSSDLPTYKALILNGRRLVEKKK